MAQEERLPWVPYYPAKLLGALSGMPADQKLVYQIVLLRIYDVWGPCPDTVDVLARRCGINKRRTSDALDALFRSKKIHREGDGIMNPFAAEVMAETEAFRQERVRAGQKGATARWEKDKKKQRPPDSKANATAMANDSHLHLQDSLFPNGNKAAEPAAPDERTRLFREGLSTLVRISGRTESGCRSLIAGWLKSFNDDAVAIRRAIEDAARDHVAEPIPWVIRALESRTGKRGGTGNGEKSGGGTSGAFAVLKDGLRNGQLSIPAEPTRPGLVRRAGPAADGLLPQGQRERPDRLRIGHDAGAEQVSASDRGVGDRSADRDSNAGEIPDNPAKLR